MTTFGEIVYAVLDILKERSDDAYYTEEHIIFLASKMRALLLERKYKNTRNSPFESMSDENKQEICLDLEPTEALPNGCSGVWLHSVDKIPNTLKMMEPKLSTNNGLLHSMVTFIPAERMPYVGYNKWLKNIIYAAIGADDHLYLKSNNGQFVYLEKVRMEAIFSNPEEAAKLSCDPESGNGCDILSMEFPLEASLIPSCIEMTIQELLGSRYAPEDKANNAKDDFEEANVTQARHLRPAESTTNRKTTDAE